MEHSKMTITALDHITADDVIPNPLDEYGNGVTFEPGTTITTAQPAGYSIHIRDAGKGYCVYFDGSPIGDTVSVHAALARIATDHNQRYENLGPEAKSELEVWFKKLGIKHGKAAEKEAKAAAKKQVKESKELSDDVEDELYEDEDE